MSQNETEIVYGNQFLKPEHAGIVAWRYSGHQGWLGRYFSSDGHTERFFTDSAQRAAATLEKVRTGLGSHMVLTNTIEYNDVLAEYLRAEHGHGETGQWSAIVAERRTCLTPGMLAVLQQTASYRTRLDAQSSSMEIAAAQHADIILSDETIRDSVAHAATHLHTVNPRLVMPEQPDMPVQGLWLPDTTAHH